MSKAIDAGKDFLTGVLAKISDPEKRAQVEAVFGDPAAADALVAIGAGALAQSDINRRYTDLQAKEETLKDDYQKLNDWYETRKSDLADYAEIKRTGGLPKPPTNPAAPAVAAAADLSGLVTKDEFGKIMSETQQSAAHFLALQNTLTLSHYRDFNEVPDFREILQDPQLGKPQTDGRVYSLVDAYRTKYADKLREKATKDEDARINTLVEARWSERLKQHPSLPMPVRGAGSPLDVLEAVGADATQYSADAAAAEYQRLQQARGSA